MSDCLAARSQKLRILYVEDRVPDMELALKELEHAGISFNVRHVECEDEFLREVRSRAFDLVLSDYRLPGWNGMDVLRTLKAQHIEIPFILVTGTLGDEAAVECIKSGAWDYVLKDNLQRLPLAAKRAMRDREEMTRRRRADDKLLLQSAALESAANAIMITDEKGIIQWVNSAFCRLTLYSADEIIGRNPRILNSGKQDPSFFEDLWKTIVGGNVWRGRIINKRKDGTLYTEEETITPVRSEMGSISHFIAIKEDISVSEELKTRLLIAQEEQAESEEQYRLLFEANPNPMWVYEVETLRFLAVNKAALQAYGYSQEEFASMSIKDIRPRDELTRFLEEYKVWDKTSDIDRGIWRHKKKDGRTMNMEISSRPIKFEGLQARLVLALDVTERLEAENALRASEQRLATMFRSSPEGITMSTLDQGKYLEANDAFLRMLNYEKSEVIGRTALELGIWVDREARANLFRVMRSQGRVAGFEADFRTKDGEVRRVQISAERIEFQGTPCLLGIIRDVSEQKQLEQQFRQAQKMEAVGRLAAGVAHDFNNLLMIIGSSAELLQLSKTDIAKVDRYTTDIQKAADRAAELTRQLLAFSRQQPLQPSVVELNQVIRDLWRMLPRLLGEDIAMVDGTEPGTGKIKIDRGQLEQVVMNLAVNARDAMPMGGKLIIETHNVDLDTTYAKQHGIELVPGSYVVLAITDTGMGMDAETKARIFEPFFTTKEKGKGTGLGLATVYGIVKQSGGLIWVYSEVGHGTTFKLYFPRVREAADSMPATVLAPAPGGNETILLVEDETVLRRVASEYLQSKGYTLLEAASGIEAVEVCKAHSGKIHLLVTDMVMPGLGGPDVAKHTLEIHPEMKVIFISGYTDKAVDKESLGSRASFLQKPFSLDVLGRRIHELISSE